MIREPNFNNMLKVLKREKPDRSTLFEFFLNDKLYELLAGDKAKKKDDDLRKQRIMMHAYKNAGYDYVTIQSSEFHFPIDRHGKSTLSLNEDTVITDWESFEKYNWPDPDSYDYSRLERLGEELPENMKFIVWSSNGVLENVIDLVGYDNLCFMIYEEPELASKVFEQVGSRLLRYFEISAEYDSVGALLANDDWGFNTQTMLCPDHMREYVIPWHKKIVAAIHKAGKPAIMHSCGNLALVMDDIIDDIGFDAKHSYEDNIIPVEDAYEKWGQRIAILGGMDLNLLCLATPDEITKRCSEMLERTQTRGGYALGSGNSIPDYVPVENYLAMIKAAGISL